MFSQYFEPEFHEEAYDGAFVIAERIEFLPGEPEVTHDADGCRVLNLWKPPPWTAGDHPEEPSVFLEHLAYILDNDTVAIEHVLNFLAHLVQRPQERIGHALLITSEAKGIGKSTLGNVVRRLVGEQNSRVVQTKDLKSSFDGWLMGKLVVQVDEVYEGGNWDLANKLKPLITEPTVSANIKYGPQIEIENYDIPGIVSFARITKHNVRRSDVPMKNMLRYVVRRANYPYQICHNGQNVFPRFDIAPLNRLF